MGVDLVLVRRAAIREAGGYPLHRFASGPQYCLQQGSHEGLSPEIVGKQVIRHNPTGSIAATC